MKPGEVLWDVRPDGIILVHDILFPLLSESEREDVRAGRCRLLQHEGTPILDYTDTPPKLKPGVA